MSVSNIWQIDKFTLVGGTDVIYAEDEMGFSF